METETGTPVQFMRWNGDDYWNILPAVICSVNESQVSILILSSTGNELIRNAIHADFKQAGKDYWDFLPNKKHGQFKNRIYP